MSPSDASANSPEPGGRSTAGSSFQFGIAALLILITAVAVIIRLAPALLEFAGERIVGATSYFAVTLAWLVPAFVFLGVHLAVTQPRYRVLALLLIVMGLGVWICWFTLVLGIGAPEPVADENRGGLDLANVAQGIEWTWHMILVIDCVGIVAILLTVISVRVILAEGSFVDHRKNCQANPADKA